jgi:hypothetical protein
MTEQTMNPYAAPEASIEPAVGTESSFAPFARFSAWWVFLLTIVTFGLYAYYWMFTRTQVINKNYPQHSIGTGLVWLALVVFVGQFIVSFAAGFMTPTGVATGGPLAVLEPLASILASIMWLVWIFTIRNRINRISGAVSGEPIWAGGVLTFFFSCIYLQYKINHIKDSE